MVWTMKTPIWGLGPTWGLPVMFMEIPIILNMNNGFLDGGARVSGCLLSFDGGVMESKPDSCSLEAKGE